MDIVKIQTLIAQGKAISITDIDPTQSFVQIGVYQPDNRKIGSANNSYPPFVIPLSQFVGYWGGISGLLSDQTDLQLALDSKEDISNKSIDGTLAANSDVLYSSQRAVKTYIDASVTGVLDDRGNWDASTNLFPSTGGSGPLGTILKGDLWFVSVPGTLGGNPVVVGSNFRALIDNPVLSTDWNILNSGVGYIPENIANKGIPNGYAELDATGKVPLTQLPSFNVVKITKALNGPVVTGVATQTILDSVLIPANTFKVGVAKINIRNVWTTAVSTKTTRIWINTTNSLVGATLIGVYSAGASTRSIDMARILAVKSLTSFQVLSNASTLLPAESSSAAAPTNITYNAAVNNYIIVSTLQLAGESGLNSYISFEI
jgi:hypothetical protein